jgi:hypothetical protein
MDVLVPVALANKKGRFALMAPVYARKTTISDAVTTTYAGLTLAEILDKCLRPASMAALTAFVSIASHSVMARNVGMMAARDSVAFATRTRAVLRASASACQNTIRTAAGKDFAGMTHVVDKAKLSPSAIMVVTKVCALNRVNRMPQKRTSQRTTVLVTTMDLVTTMAPAQIPAQVTPSLETKKTSSTGILLVKTTARAASTVQRQVATLE